MDIQLYINILLVVAIGFLAQRQTILQYQFTDSLALDDGTPEYEEGRAAYHRGLSYFDNPHCGEDDNSDDMLNWWAGWCVEYQKASRRKSA